jgi:hypothetical protein
MKNLKFVYKLLLIIPLSLMVGCIAGSDDIIDVFTNTTTTPDSSVYIETDDTHDDIVTSIGYLESAIVTAGVNNAPESDLTVSFSVTRNGAPAVAGLHYTLEDATISSGSNYGSSSITFTAGGTFEVMVGSSSDGSLTVVNNKVTFEVEEYVGIGIRIDWADAFYDYDLYLYEGNQSFAVLIDNTFGTANFEEFSFGALPLGESSLWIDDWWDDNASIDVLLTVYTNDGGYTFDVVMDMDKWTLLINTTDNGDGTQSYDLTAL